METEIEILKRENAELKAKVAELEAQIEVLKAEKNICPYCKKPGGKLLDTRPTFYLGQFGLTSEFYKCGNCGKEYEKQHQL